MSIMFNPSQTYLDENVSGRLRQLLRNACDLHRVTVRQLKLAGVFPDDSSRSTVARIVSGANDFRVQSRFLPLCVKWLSEVTGCPSADLSDYLLVGITENVAILELTARRVFTHTAPQLASFASEVKVIEARATQCWVVSDIPPASLLPEPVMQKIYRWKTESMPQPFHDFRIELDFGRRRWQKFQDHAGHRLSACGVILTLSGMDQLFRSDGACPLTPYQKDLLVETLLDRVEVYGIKIGLLDDRAGRAAKIIRPFLDRFDMLAVFDHDVSIRRFRDRSERILYVASDSGPQAAVVKADGGLIEFARQRATFDPAAVSEWLLEHASDDSWRKIRQRMDARF